MKSIGDKIVYPARSNPGAIQGITYKESLVLRISNDTSITAVSVIRRANQIIALLDAEREQNVTKSK